MNKFYIIFRFRSQKKDETTKNALPFHLNILTIYIVFILSRLSCH